MKDLSKLSTAELEQEIAKLEASLTSGQDEESVLKREAENNNVDYNLLKAIDTHESAGGNPNAISPTGVEGRFQITNSTFKNYGGINKNDFNDVARVAGKIVGNLKAKYNGDIPKILAAYNAGEGVVDEAEQLASEKGTNWMDEIPNTRSINNVTDDIIRAKRRRNVSVGSFDEEKASKIKEIQTHRDRITNLYNKNLYDQVSKMSTSDLEKLVGQLSGEVTEEQPQQPQTHNIEPTQHPPSTFGENISATGKSLASSALDLLSGVTRLPALATKSFIDFINKTVGGETVGDEPLENINIPKWLETAGGIAPKLNEVANSLKTSKETGTGNILNDLVSDFNDGEYGKAIQNLYYSALESALPSLGAVGLAIITKNPSAAATTMGITSAGSKYGELSDKKDISSSQQVQSSILTGTLETIFSKMDIKMFEPLIRGKTKKEASEIISNEIKKKLLTNSKDVIKNVGKWEATNVGEFINEGFTQLSQDFADNIVGVSNYKPKEMIERSVGAGILGHVAAMPLSTIQTIVENKGKNKKTSSVQSEPVEEGPSVEPFFGRNDAQTFIADYNTKTPEEQQFMIGELSDSELEQITQILSSIEPVKTEEVSQVSPTEQPALEQPQNAPSEVSAQPVETPLEISTQEVKKEEPSALDVSERMANLPQMKEKNKGIITEVKHEEPTTLAKELDNFAAEQKAEEPVKIKEPKKETVKNEQEKEVSKETLLKEPVKEEKPSDKENITRIPSEERVREESVKEEPIKETGGEKISSGRNVQTHKEKVTQKKKEQQYHLTSKANADSIIREGFKELGMDDPRRMYSDSPYSGAIYTSDIGSHKVFWGTGGKSRMPNYDVSIPIEFDESKNITISNQKDWNDLIAKTGVNEGDVDDVMGGYPTKQSLFKLGIESITFDGFEPAYGANKIWKETIHLKPQNVKIKGEPVSVDEFLGKKKPITQQTTPESVSKVTPKKDITKYTFDELKTLYETDNSKKKKLRTLASEAGVKVKPGETWQSIIANYAEMHGTSEDKIKAEKFYKESHSIKTSKSILAAQDLREQETGTSKSGKSAEKYSLLKDLEDGNIIIYNPDPEKGQGKFIDSIVEDPKKPGKYNIVPTKGNNQLRYAIDVIKGKDGFALQMSPRGLQMIEEARSGKGEFVPYDEAVKYTDTEESDLKQAAIEEEPIKDIEEDTGIAARNDESYGADFKKTKDLLDQMYNSGKIDDKKYKFALEKLREEFDDETVYSKAKGESFSMKNTIDSGKVGDIEIIEGTDEDKKAGEELAKQIPDIKYNGIQQGIKVTGKEGIPAKHMFTIINRDEHTTFTVPFGSTKEQVQKIVDEKINAFKSTSIKKHASEIKKLFKDSTTLPEIRVDNSIKSKSGQRERKLSEKDYGAITRENDKTVILLNPNIDPNEIIPTLLHELVGHWGISKLFNEIDTKLAQHIRDLFEKDKNSEFTKALQRTYFKQIVANPNILFDEWVAKRLEQIGQEFFNEDGTFNEKKYKANEGILRKVYDFIESLIGKIFDKWFQKDATEEEIRNAFGASLQRLKTVDFTGESGVKTRYSKVPTGEKRKRVAPKALKKREKLSTFVNDKILLETAKDAKQVKLRFFDFATKHFYAPINGTSPESYRRQILDVISKVKEVNDNYHKEALKLVNEFSDYMDASNAYYDVKRFKQYNSRLLHKTSDKTIKSINDDLKNIEEDQQKYVDFQVIRRLEQRKSVKRPYIRGTKILSKIGDKYQRLVNAGVVDPNKKDKDGDTTYTLTDNYKEYKDKIVSELTDKNGVMFNAGDITSRLNILKEKLKNEVKVDIKKAKINKKTTVDEAIKAVTTHIKSLNPKYLREVKGDIARGVLRKLKSFDLTTSNLEYICNTLDGFTEGPLTKYIFNVLDDARSKSLKYGQDMNDFLKEELKDIPTEELRAMSESFNSGVIATLAGDKIRKVKKETFKFENGEIELTPTQKISISMISKNDDGYRHLVEGGMSLSENGSVLKLTPKDLVKLEKSLTPNEQKISETLFSFYKKQGNAINKVSNEDVGYDIAGVFNYHPLRARGADVTRDVESISNLKQLTEHFVAGTPSNLKQRVKSSAPLIIEGAFEALARTSDLVEKYIGQAIPTKRVESLLKNNELQNIFIDKGLDLEYNTIKRLFEEFQKPATFRSGVGDKFIRALNNRFTIAVLGYKIPTALMQLPSVFLYFNEVDPSIVKKLHPQILKGRFSGADVDKTEKLIYKYSPVIRNRYEGHIDRDTGELISNAKARNMFMGKENRIINKIFSAEGAMSIISALDKQAVTMAWYIAELETNTQDVEKGSDEYYKRVAKRTEFLVRRTQATYDVLDRPLITNANAAVRALTMFTSQPVKMLMMVRRSVADAMSKDRNKRIRGYFGLLNVLLLQPILIESIRMPWNYLKELGKDDEDKYNKVTLWLKVLADDLQLYPILGTIVGSLMSGYNVNFGGPTQEYIDASTKLGKAIYNKGEGYDSEKVIKAAGKLLDVTIPKQGPQQAIEVLNGAYIKAQELAQ